MKANPIQLVAWLNICEHNDYIHVIDQVRAEVINECVIPSIMDKCPSTSSALSLAQNALLLAEEINDVAEDHCEASDMVL